MRAFALQRTGKSDEALATLQSIADKGPESERVLHTMTFTYRAAGKPEAIASTYAIAAEKHPQDLEILKGLFGAYAKELNFVKQQQIALKLAKSAPEEADKYSWWAIVSLALQARAAVVATPPGSNAEQLMKLAETMIARQITKGKGALPSYEALLLYTDILQGQGKATEAAALIKETTGTVAGGLKDDSRQLLAAALVRSGNLLAAAELFKEACLENTDDWWSWHEYLNCILPSSVKNASIARNPSGIAFPVGIVGGLAEIWDSKHLEAVWESAAAGEVGKQGVGVKPIDTVVKEATETLEVLKRAATKQSRGAALAPLELECRLHSLGLHSGRRQLSEAIVAALPTICHSFSCAIDLRKYISHIESAEDRVWLAERVVTVCEDAAKSYEKENSTDNGDTSSKSNKAAIKAFWCRINAHVLQQELGCVEKRATSTSSSSPAAVDYAVQLVDLFSSNLGLSENLDPKDRGHGEDLVALAVASLVSAALKKGDDASLLLLTASLAIEAAQVRRTVAAPLRLSACGLYALLNAPKKAIAQLTALDVKSILHESITGHWALPTLLASASPESDFEKWLSGISNVHVDQVIEASESIFTAYEQGTYSKVPEFVDFWETLGNSHTRWSGAAERNILKLQNSSSSSGSGSNNKTGTPGGAGLAAAAKEIVAKDPAGVESTRPHVDNLRFNEDLSTRPAWFPPAAVDTRLAIASWWEERSGAAAAAMPAASEMWWGVPKAAERTHPEAEKWRNAQRHGLARRQALPQLLAGLLQPTLLKDDERDELSQLLLSLWAPESCCPSSSSSEIFSNLLNVSKSLFSAGIAVHCAVSAATGAGAGGDAAALCENSCTCLHRFEQQFLNCVTEISDYFKDGDRNMLSLPLPVNAGPALLAAVLSEEALWTAACLPTWAKLIKTSLNATDNTLGSDLKTKLQNSIHSAANSVYLALLAVKEQLSARASLSTPPAVLATEILSKIESTWPCVSKLWNYESNFNAKNALQEVFAEQQAVVKRMNQLATQATTSLKQFAS